MKRLSDMRPGERLPVLRLSEDDPDLLRKILSLGILPGDLVVLLRRSPAFVFEVGRSQFAIDRELADCIEVG
jgi:Fe2+ transport system protein FeoA